MQRVPDGKAVNALVAALSGISFCAEKLDAQWLRSLAYQREGWQRGLGIAVSTQHRVRCSVSEGQAATTPVTWCSGQDFSDRAG